MTKTVKLFFIFATFIVWNAYAYADEQRFTVNNNGTVIAIASLKEITRIVFSHDIDAIESIVGDIQYNVKGKNLYLRTSNDKPINFFVSTSPGFTYKFILDIRDIPATQIFVSSKVTKKKKKKTIIYGEQKISVELGSRISKIIDVALHPKSYIGFNITKEEKDLGAIEEDNCNISLTKVGKITGKRLEAEKIIMSNESDNTCELKLPNFIKEGTLAVYMDKTSLVAQEKGILIRIGEE